MKTALRWLLTAFMVVAVFSPPLAPGRYTLACRIVACAPVPFVVAP